MIQKRLPIQRDIKIAFGFLVFVVFSWSIRGFLYKSASFLLYYDLGDVFGVFFYMMGFALLESVFVIGALLLVALILPQKWFREGFSYRASLTVLVVGVAMIFLQDSITFKLPRETDLLLGFVISLGTLLGLNILFSKVERLRNILGATLERFVIFPYIYVPLGFVGLVVVILRNLF